MGAVIIEEEGAGLEVNLGRPIVTVLCCVVGCGFGDTEAARQTDTQTHTLITTHCSHTGGIVTNYVFIWPVYEV